MVVVDPDGRSRPVALATITGDPVAWSSDGSELLISDAPRLEVLGIGGRERMVARDANFGRASFTPDGREVVYVDKDSVIREVSVLGGRARAIAGGNATPTGYGGLALSLGGTRIAYGRAGNTVFPRSVWVMNANGTGRHVLVPEARLNRLAGNPVTETADVCWSPDGSQLAFTASTGNATQSSVFTVNADGTGLRRLTPMATRIWGASWSPDGRRLASMSAGREVISIRTDGTHIRALGYRSLTWGPPAWNPARPVVTPPHG